MLTPRGVLRDYGAAGAEGGGIRRSEGVGRQPGVRNGVSALDVMQRVVERMAGQEVRRVMEHDFPQINAPDGWVEALLGGKTDIAAGRTYPLLPILEEMRAEAEEIDRQSKPTPDGERATTGR